MNILFESTISDIFNKFDLVVNNTIDFKEFKGFTEIIGIALKDEAEFKNTILARFNSHEGALTLRGFKDWWKQQLFAQGQPQIWQWLEKLGYDRDFYSNRSRVFGVIF
jgi:hypothetical protein